MNNKKGFATIVLAADATHDKMDVKAVVKVLRKDAMGVGTEGSARAAIKTDDKANIKSPPISKADIS